MPIALRNSSLSTVRRGNPSFPRRKFNNATRRMNSAFGRASHLAAPRTRDRFFFYERGSPRTYSAAAAEAYVADYMRSMQHQLPPLPYVAPPGIHPASPYDGLAPPPRYFFFQ